MEGCASADSQSVAAHECVVGCGCRSARSAFLVVLLCLPLARTGAVCRMPHCYSATVIVVGCADRRAVLLRFALISCCPLARPRTGSDETKRSLPRGSISRMLRCHSMP